MKKHILSLAAGAALVFAAQTSFADILAAGSKDYYVTLTAGCEVITQINGGAIELADQLSYAGNTDWVAAGSLVVKCSNIPYGICVNGGAAPTATTRRLAGQAPLDPTADFLAYDLRTGGVSVGDGGCDAIDNGYAETADWASFASTSDGNGTGEEDTYTFEAQVTIPFDSLPGTYEDTVTFSLVF